MDVEFSMNNLWKAIRDSLHHTPSIVLATLCSLGVALLWGSNIGALAPVIDMTLRGESMQSWTRKSIEQNKQKIASLEQQINTTPLATDKDNLDVANFNKDLAKERKNLAWNEWTLSWENALLPQDPFQTICCIMGVLMISTLVKHLLMLASDLLIGHVSTKIIRTIRQRVFDASLSMDRKTFQTFGTSGFLAAITGAADGLAAGLMSLFGAAIREPLRIIACLVGACLISWRLLLLTVVFAPLLIMVVAYFNRKIRSIASSILGRNAGFHEVLLEALNNVFTVQAFTMEKQEKERFSICTNDMRLINIKMIFYTGLSKPFTELVGIGMVALTVCAGAYLVINQKTHIFFIRVCDNPMSISELLIFFGLLVGASDPLRKLSGVSISIYNAAMSANLLYSIIESKPVLQEIESPVQLESQHSVLALKQVSFHYDPGQNVLTNIDLEIPFGKTIAILGSNGSGKSTMIQLLCRYYDPVEGTIAMDGVDYRNLAIQDVRKRIALVSQNTELFNRSVLENIQYGSPDATRDEVVAASVAAHAHSFIEGSLSNAYETIVGQSGQRLSGGQRQRIALARAILRKPEVLILDESTSQIDMASELQIRETLQTMKGQMTMIIITHREALLTLADEVYQMQNGSLHRVEHNVVSSAA
jgi:ATP-binding cassette subfamily B protein/subfamily B ATP-binding cassette protein MsbA